MSGQCMWSSVQSRGSIPCEGPQVRSLQLIHKPSAWMQMHAPPAVLLFTPRCLAMAQVERSSASCSALQHQQRKSLPKVNLKSKSKTAQEDSQRLLATPPGPLSKRGSKGDLQTFSRESPTLMRCVVSTDLPA
eukprot:1140344-Pelagomonas_calceolata.AAC.5